MEYDLNNDKELIVALFNDEDALHRTIKTLKSQNFLKSDISILLHPGGKLIAIHIENHDWEKKAREILEENGSSYLNDFFPCDKFSYFFRP